MKCPNCEREVEPSAQFCGNCGYQLQQPAQQPIAPQPVAPVAGQPPVAPPATPQSTVASGQPLPAYSVDQASLGKDGSRLTMAVIFAILSLPGALIPIVGLGFGITAIVLAARHHRGGTVRTVVAIIFASIGVLFALAAWNYNIQQSLKERQSGFVPVASATTALVTAERDTVSYLTLVSPVR